MYNIAIFKERTKALCKKNGISQKFLSESTGNGQYYLNDVWLGKRDASDSDLQTISKILHTTPEYLKGETDNPDAPEQNTIDESQIKAALFGGDKEVTDEMWDEVKNFVEFVIQKHQKGDK